MFQQSVFQIFYIESIKIETSNPEYCRSQKHMQLTLLGAHGKARTAGRWNIVVNGSQRAVVATHLTPRIPQTFKRLWRRHFMDQMAVNVDQRCAIIFLMHNVFRENFVIQGSSGRLGGSTAKITTTAIR